jgi:2-amino-4-hydroxy-6-hydroxymethyldihydropteridine diphosphokinase
VTTAYVGIGSNLKDPRAQVLQAFNELEGLPQTRVVKKSSLYRTEPIGHAEQADYINAVAQLETGLPAERLLAELQEVEARHGRERIFPNAPRTLDLDVLLFGNAVLDTPSLKLPHPRMHERAFVLKPLVEVFAQATIPGHGLATALLASCKDQKVERID